MTHRMIFAVKILSVTLVACSSLSISIWIGFTKLKGYSSNPFTYAVCNTETQANFENVAGWDFEVEDSSCDTLAKDEEVRLFAISSQAKNSRLGRLFARRKLIFAYDPGTTGVNGLTVQPKDSNQILISLSKASSVIKKERTLGELVVDYDIQQIEYP